MELYFYLPPRLHSVDKGFTFVFVTYWMQVFVELVGVNLGEEQDEDAGRAKMQHYNQSSPVMQGKCHFWSQNHEFLFIFLFLRSPNTYINKLMEVTKFIW